MSTCACGENHVFICTCGELRQDNTAPLEQLWAFYTCVCARSNMIHFAIHEEKRAKPLPSICTVLKQTADYIADKITLLQGAREGNGALLTMETMRTIDKQLQQRWGKLNIAVQAKDLDTVKVLCRSIIQEYKKHLQWK